MMCGDVGQNQSDTHGTIGELSAYQYQNSQQLSLESLDIFEWKLGLDEREIFSIFSLMWSTVTTSDA